MYDWDYGADVPLPLFDEVGDDLDGLVKGFEAECEIRYAIEIAIGTVFLPPEDESDDD